MQRSDRTDVGGLDEMLDGSLAGHESIVAEDSIRGCAAPHHYSGPAASDLTYTLDREEPHKQGGKGSVTRPRGHLEGGEPPVTETGREESPIRRRTAGLLGQ